MVLPPLVLSIYLARRNAASIYDWVIVRPLTSLWYSRFLSLVPPGSVVLDVGMGTATAALNSIGTLRSKDVTLVGIDVEPRYVQAANANARRAAAEDRVGCHLCSVYDEGAVGGLAEERGGFDAAYFSGSISLLPDPQGAIRAAANCVKKGGFIYVTQTFNKREVPMMRLLKPALFYLTTIDFGKLTMEADIMRIYREAGLEIVRHEKIPGSVDNFSQAAYISVLRV